MVLATLGIIGAVVYILGWIVSIYPIYFRLVLSKRKSSNYTIMGDTPYGFLPVMAAVLALGWPLIAPFQISHLIHTKSLASLTDTQRKAQEHENRIKQAKRITDKLDAQHAKSVDEAMKELENLE